MNDMSTITTRTIGYDFTVLSPWAYIGHTYFSQIVRRHGVAVHHHPVALSTVFPESGGLPLAKRHPSRQNYRLVELLRWREHRGLRFDLHPRLWPFDPTSADRVVLALLAARSDPHTFIRTAFAAVWEQNRDLAGPDELQRLLREGGYDEEAVSKAARAPAVGDAYAGETRAARDAGVFGSPSYMLDGELFWGQDRPDLLDDALTSGRASYVP